MNIFFLNNRPAFAAADLCDKHVVKMQVESIQLLSATIPLDILQTKYCPTAKGKPRRHTHLNHPMTKWLLTDEYTVWASWKQAWL